GAIVPGFQAAAARCDRTVLLESGPGHATRCVLSSFVEEFEREKRSMLRAELSGEEVCNRLEGLNVGRLCIASKGLDRHPDYQTDPMAPKLVAVEPEQQWARGMYMIGPVAAIRDSVCSVAELHHAFAAASSLRLVTTPVSRGADEPATLPAAAVAIVGMVCILPGASDLETYWSNILNKVDAVGEVPSER